jgi:hypothetical protein
MPDTYRVFLFETRGVTEKLSETHHGLTWEQADTLMVHWVEDAWPQHSVDWEVEEG